MFRNLTDAIKFLKKKKATLNDEDGAPMTEEDIIALISVLETQLDELKDSEDADAANKAEEVSTQLAELKAQLESMKSTAPTPTDDAPESDDKDAKIAELTAENAALEQENEELKAELEKLKSEQETESTLTDAKSRFPKIGFNDAKSARDVRITALVKNRVYTDTQAKCLNDSELRAAYAALCVAAKPKSRIGEVILGDSKPKATKTAAQRLGGK